MLYPSAFSIISHTMTTVTVSSDIPKLDGPNYEDWKRPLMHELMAQGLQQYVVDFAKEPPLDYSAVTASGAAAAPQPYGEWTPQYQTWRAKERQAWGLIAKNCDQLIAKSLNYEMTAARLWADLATRYTVPTWQLRINALMELSSMRRKPDELVLHYRERMKPLFARLADKDGMISVEDLETVHLLSTLGPEFKTAVSTVHATLRGDFSMGTVLPVLVQEENLLLKERESGGSVAYATTAAPPAAKQSCTNAICVAKGNAHTHTLDKCWQQGGGREGQSPWERKKKRAAEDKAKQGGVVANLAQAAPAVPAGPDFALASLTLADEGEDTLIAQAYVAGAVDDIFAPIPETAEYDDLYLQDSRAMDTAASHHVFNDAANFRTYEPIAPKPVRGIGGQIILALGKGTVHHRLGKGRTLLLRDVLHVPDAKASLVSVGALADDGYFSLFGPTGARILTKNGQTVATARRHANNLYKLTESIAPATAFAATAQPDLMSWHKRLGHASFDYIKSLARRGLIAGAGLTTSTPNPVCEHCLIGKQVRTPYPRESHHGRRGCWKWWCLMYAGRWRCRH